jgi:hypothetical protein
MKAEAPLLALKVTTGVGKTEQLLQALSQRPDLRAAMLIPRHKLTNELLERAAALGIVANAYRGREARNPAASDGSLMCIEPAILKAAKEADMVDEACTVCPSRSRCPFLLANKREPARLEIASNNFLSRRPPALLVSKANKIQLLVIDESFIDRMIDEARTLLLDALSTLPPASPMTQADIDAARAPMRRALAAARHEGRLLKRHLTAEGIDADTCRQGEASEWAAKPKTPRLTDEDAIGLVATLARYAGRFDNRPAMLWRTLAQFLEAAEDEEAEAGAIAFVTTSTTHGDAPAVEFRVRRKLHKAWYDVPVLVMDAEALPTNAELKALFGREPARVEVSAEVPSAVRVYQLVDPLPTAALVDGDYNAKPKLRDVADRVEVLARRYAGQGRDGTDLLAIGGTTAIADRMREELITRGLDVAPKIGATRRHAVEVRHCGDLAGEDAYGGVRAMVQMGWPLPPARKLERQVGAATGVMPHRLPGEAWAMVPAGLRLRDGSGYRVHRPVHPDPAVEELRRRKTEGEIGQGIGRPRWTRRQENSPLDFWILSPIPLAELTVDRPLQWRDVVVRRLELAFWRLGGVLPCRPADLVLTRLWLTERAAKAALKGQFPFIIDPLRENCPFELTPTRYRRVNQSRWSAALVGAWLAPEVAAQRLRAATGIADLIVELGTTAPPSLPEARPPTFAAAMAALIDAGFVPNSPAAAGPLLAAMLPEAFRSPQEADEWLTAIPAEDRVFTLPEAALGRNWQPEEVYLVINDDELVPADVLVACDGLAATAVEPAPDLEAWKPSFVPDELFPPNGSLHRPLAVFWGREGSQPPPRLPATLGSAGLTTFPASIFADRWRRHAGLFGAY